MPYEVLDASTAEAIRSMVDGTPLPVIAETSNPGPVGKDTGHVFWSPRTKTKIRVIAKQGETDADAIRRVRGNHGV